jgi:Amt family ammonium transporter
VGVVLALAVGGTLAIALAIKATIGLQVTGEVETIGLDLTQHGESGYAGPGASSEADPELGAGLKPVG